MSAILAWTNYVKGATIATGSAATTMPGTNVAGDQGSPSAAWQTAAGVITNAAGANITITPPGIKGYSVLGMFGTNLTPAATVTFTLKRTVLTTTTTTWSAVVPGPVSGYGQVVALQPPGYAAQGSFLVIGIDDPTNPDGFINVPLIFAGPSWVPLGSTGFNSVVGRDDSTAEVVTRGGQEYPTLLWQRRRWNIEFDSVRQSETWADVDPLFRLSKAGGNVFFCPNATSANLQQEAIFGRLKGTADISYPYSGADRRRWQASITERL
jgi:hypothetical protein